MEELLDYEGLIYSIISKYPKRFDRDDYFSIQIFGIDLDAVDTSDQLFFHII